jgi:lysozyme family protein
MMHRRHFVAGTLAAPILLLRNDRAAALASNYGRALANVLVAEGGWSNHRNDPGRETLNGVTQARYNEFRRDQGLPPRALTPAMEHTDEWRAERAIIYRRYYADPLAFNALPPGLAYQVFDFGVNAGIARGWSSLMVVLELETKRPWSPLADVVPAIKRRGTRSVIIAYGNERRRFYNALSAQRPALAVFRAGWLNRESHSRRIALLMESGVGTGRADMMPPSRLLMGKAIEAEEELIP